MKLIDLIFKLDELTDLNLYFYTPKKYALYCDIRTYLKQPKHTFTHFDWSSDNDLFISYSRESIDNFNVVAIHLCDGNEITVILECD